MSVIVRFAPSPTGKLHVGNVRTALMNFLFAREKGGKVILRIDDTDLERSTAAYEAQIKEDLTWLGLPWDESFNQSKRFAKYDAARDDLKARGLLYPCYETAEELDRQRKIQRSQSKPPVYNRAALQLSEDEIAKYEAEGRKPHWRFKLSGNPVTWTDKVRGEQSVDTSSLSDPVLIRADGSYLYTLPSVVDDIDAKITHVIRGEDHVTNSGAQIEIFKALSDHLPQFAHTPLLVGADGKGLSKRLGSLSMDQLREQSIEPLAITSLLAKIGTSDAIEIRESLDQLTAEFSFDKIGRAPARFDEAELELLNSKLIHTMDYEDVKDRLKALGIEGGKPFWMLVRGNLTRITDAAQWATIINAPMAGQISDEDKAYCLEAADNLRSRLDEHSWGVWTAELKNKTGRKGRGLYLPLRLALTGRKYGPEMDKLLPLLGTDRAIARLKGEVA